MSRTTSAGASPLDELLAHLNPQQRAAAVHGHDPLLIVAGAGTGKTTTLAHRVASLIARGVAPGRILLLTFTRRSSAEMLRRVDSLLTQWRNQSRRKAALASQNTDHNSDSNSLVPSPPTSGERERVREPNCDDVLLNTNTFDAMFSSELTPSHSASPPHPNPLPLKAGGEGIRMVSTRDVWGGTFHAVATRLLRQHGKLIGLEPDFTILDRSDAEDLLNVLRSELELAKADKRFPLKGTCLDIYSRVVNTQLPLDQVLKESFPWVVDQLDGLKKLFAAFTERKEQQQTLDYDDLLLFWHGLMTEPACGEIVRQKFDCVLVDEYQDTNTLQSEIVRGLCPTGRGLTVVGDDAQSIYSFARRRCAIFSTSRSNFRARVSCRWSRIIAVRSRFSKRRIA